MNIAFVLPSLAERIGGPVCVVKNVGAVLSALGHIVSYWATGDENDRKKFASVDSAHIYDPIWPRSWFCSKGLASNLSAGIASMDIMHINSFWPYPVYAASRIARAHDTPYLLSPAGVFMHPWRYRTAKKQVYLHLFGNRILKGAACFHAASEMEAEGCREAGIRTPITIIPNGIDPKMFGVLPPSSDADERWPVLKDRLVVLFLSRISPEKGLDQCLPAIRDVIDAGGPKDVLFVIAGPDHKGFLATVKDLVKQYCLNSHVFFPGMVHGLEKLALYRRADLFVLPSYSENFGIVITEALACGTPVLTTTGTPWKELQDIDVGRWVAPEKGALAEALRDLLGMSDAKRREMGRHGRKHVFENYTWENSARKLWTVYRCILEGRDIPMYPEPWKT